MPGRHDAPPKAAIVFDRFHVDQAVQRQTDQSCGGTCIARSKIDCRKNVLKGIRWLFLKNDRRISTPHATNATTLRGSLAAE